MIERNAYNLMKQWAERENRKPLVLRGARLRMWSQPLSVDKVKTQAGKEFTLLNVPFYYA